MAQETKKMYFTKCCLENYLETLIFIPMKNQMPFEMNFNRKPNTICKQLASGKPSIGILDNGTSIRSKERTKDWNADDRVEDAYKDTLIPKKNLTSTEKGYDTDYASTAKTTTSRLPLQSLFKGKILRKTNERVN